MAHFHENSSLQNYAQQYLERCKQIQKLANSDPFYKLPTFQPDQDASSVIVILDDDDKTHAPRDTPNTYPATNYLQELLRSSPIASSPTRNGRNYPNNTPNGRSEDQSTDLRITGVGVLREWIDISELDWRKHIETGEIPAPHARKRPSTSNTPTGHRPEEKRRKKPENVSSPNRRIEETGRHKRGVVTEMNANWADLYVEEATEESDKTQLEAQPKEEIDIEYGRLDVDPQPKEEPEYENSLPESVETENAKRQPRPGTKTPTENPKTSNSSEDRFRCDYCPYVSNWKCNLAKHVVTRHQSPEDIRWFDCAHCPYRGKTREYLRSHMRQSHDESPFKVRAPQKPRSPEDGQRLTCEQCPFQCKYQQTLQEHRRYRHTADSDVVWFECQLCTYRGKTRREMRKHQAKAHPGHEDLVWIACDRCDFECLSQETLTRHAHSYHPDVDAAADDVPETGLECKRCGVKILNRAELAEHLFCRNGKTCCF